MRNPLDVAAIVGSLRRDSYTRRLTEALGRLAGDSMRIDIVSIRARCWITGPRQQRV
jgi:NAD(P)H-dependent FMN reductase